MKQVVYEKFGPPSTVAKCVEAPDPQAPSAWEVIVAVDAFPINPADLAMMYGQYGILNKPPSTIGMEAVGTVVEKGKSVAICRLATELSCLPTTTGLRYERSQRHLRLKCLTI